MNNVLLIRKLKAKELFQEQFLAFFVHIKIEHVQQLGYYSLKN